MCSTKLKAAWNLLGKNVCFLNMKLCNFCFQLCFALCSSVHLQKEIFICQSMFLPFHTSSLRFGFAQPVANVVYIPNNSRWRKSSCSLTPLSPAHKSCTFAEREQILEENTHGARCSRVIRLGPVYWLGKQPAGPRPARLLASDFIRAFAYERAACLDPGSLHQYVILCD